MSEPFYQNSDKLSQLSTNLLNYSLCDGNNCVMKNGNCGNLRSKLLTISGVVSPDCTGVAFETYSTRETQCQSLDVMTFYLDTLMKGFHFKQDCDTSNSILEQFCACHVTFVRLTTKIPKNGKVIFRYYIVFRWLGALPRRSFQIELKEQTSLSKFFFKLYRENETVIKEFATQEAAEGRTLNYEMLRDFGLLTTNNWFQSTGNFYDVFVCDTANYKELTPQALQIFMSRALRSNFIIKDDRQIYELKNNIQPLIAHLQSQEKLVFQPGSHELKEEEELPDVYKIKNYVGRAPVRLYYYNRNVFLFCFTTFYEKFFGDLGSSNELICNMHNLNIRRYVEAFLINSFTDVSIIKGMITLCNNDADELHTLARQTFTAKDKFLVELCQLVLSQYTLDETDVVKKFYKCLHSFLLNTFPLTMKLLCSSILKNEELYSSIVEFVEDVNEDSTLFEEIPNFPKITLSEIVAEMKIQNGEGPVESLAAKFFLAHFISPGSLLDLNDESYDESEDSENEDHSGPEGFGTIVMHNTSTSSEEDDDESSSTSKDYCTGYNEEYDCAGSCDELTDEDS